MNISFGENSNINFYFSFQCPYSFIAWEILRKVCKNQENITINPINIGLFPPSNNKYCFREFWSDDRWEKISKEAFTNNIILIKPQEIYSEELTSRCIKEYGTANAEFYISTVFKAAFTAHINISSLNAMRYFLQNEGIDSNILADSQSNSKTLLEYEKRNELWSKNRIRAIPTIEVGKERLAGLINKNQLENLLRSIAD